MDGWKMKDSEKEGRGGRGKKKEIKKVEAGASQEKKW